MSLITDPYPPHSHDAYHLHAAETYAYRMNDCVSSGSGHEDGGSGMSKSNGHRTNIMLAEGSPDYDS